MNRLVLSYGEFINEAYIDQEGRLQDLEFTQSDLYASEMVDQINQIREFLEDAGATRVRVGDYHEDPIVFRFQYGPHSYFMELNLDDDTVTVYAKTGRGEVPQEMYRDSAQGFFDLAMNSGLDFLMF
jgi:hypothetical protein